VRRLLLITALLALTLAPTASGQYSRIVQGDASALELEGGRGYAIVVSEDGVLFARVARGQIVVGDRRGGAATDVDVSGCDSTRRRGRTLICAGRNLSASIVDGRWRVALRGFGISATGMVEGSLTLRGTRGTYRIGSGDERRWPRRERTFRLG
jgi:hypothetical protein